MSMSSDKTLIERITNVSRATILCRHALTDLCADYLRAVATIHAGELTGEQRETIEDIAQWFTDTADEVQYAIAHLGEIFEKK